ncbi:MAG: helix-turn-helix domain-containing protein [Alphaproteobacteria bacterium]|nr:helix-turn-helix domain-containing protein [Alphaproteobacteria bacterium]
MAQLSLSIEEVSDTTGIGRMKLYQLINDGDLKARKIGKRTIILRVDLEDFLANLQSYPPKTVRF